ncbi:MAG TPA: hypothetical protein VL282_05835 [Tepidisphaeraceae bacterium]|nr:hypothetical protein [Tepidisphaeraceae bacterium]
MKRNLIVAALILAISPAVVLAAHHKKHTSSSSSTPSQPNLYGKVVHGAQGVRAKLTVHPQGHHSWHSHPNVSSGGDFNIHLKPGTYTLYAKRRGAGKGHVTLHMDALQRSNVIIPLIHHHVIHVHQTHCLGVAHRPAKSVATAQRSKESGVSPTKAPAKAPSKTPAQNTIIKSSPHDAGRGIAPR